MSAGAVAAVPSGPFTVSPAVAARALQELVSNVNTLLRGSWCALTTASGFAGSAQGGWSGLWFLQPLTYLESVQKLSARQTSSNDDLSAPTGTAVRIAFVTAVAAMQREWVDLHLNPNGKLLCSQPLRAATPCPRVRTLTFVSVLCFGADWICVGMSVGLVASSQCVSELAAHLTTSVNAALPALIHGAFAARPSAAAAATTTASPTASVDAPVPKPTPMPLPQAIASAVVFRVGEQIARGIGDWLSRSSAATAVNPLADRSVSHSSVTALALARIADPLALDLQLSLFAAALASSRWGVIANPLPHCMAAPTTTAAAATISTAARVSSYSLRQQLLDAIDAMPALSTVATDASRWAAIPLAVPLLNWLLLSPLQLRRVPVQSDLYHVPFVDDDTDDSGDHHPDHRTATAGAAAKPSTSMVSGSGSSGNGNGKDGFSLPDYQFEVCDCDASSGAEQQPRFLEAAKRNGSFVAYHGSAACNFHSISRNGLECKSHTAEATSGALFGAGIYATADLRLARQFAGLGDTAGWATRSALGTRIEVVGQYQILNVRTGGAVRVQRDTARLLPTPHSTSHSDSTDSKAKPAAAASGSGSDGDVPPQYFVVSDAKYMRLRSLLVWTDGRARTPNPSAAQSPATTAILAPATATVAAAASSPPITALDNPHAAAPSAYARDGDGGGGGIRWSLVILAYVVLLIGIALTQADWAKWRRVWRRTHWSAWLPSVPGLPQRTQ